MLDELVGEVGVDDGADGTDFGAVSNGLLADGLLSGSSSGLFSGASGGLFGSGNWYTGGDFGSGGRGGMGGCGC